MSWISWLILAGIVAAFLLVRRMGQVSAKAARAYLAQGALVVDVRTNAEFQAGHLAEALHMPLDEVETLAARRVKDHNLVLLLHCQSGARSAVARKKLLRMGYSHVYNLGSYSRAVRIVGHS